MSTLKCRLRFAACAAVAWLALANFSQARTMENILLTVDVGTPGIVTFTATGNAPSISVDISQYSGVTLASFFTGQIDQSISTTVIGNLTPSSTVQESSGVFLSAHAYTSAGYDDISGSYLDLNLYVLPSTLQWVLQQFDTNTPAFTGSSYLVSTSPDLPTVGTTGDLVATYYAYLVETPYVIGQWTVIPEPASIGLLAIGSLTLLKRRKH